MYIGKDKFGSSIFTDFDLRSDDRTNSNVLILGNSGQGKSYLLKLLLTNIRESGKSVIVLDPEEEYKELTSSLGGCYLDFMNGEYKINPLEPKDWGNARDDTEEDSPQTFKRVTRLSQHIAFLKDFFRTCKEFNDEQLDTIEIILTKLYKRFGIDDFTDFEKLSSDSYPILSDLYDLCEEEYKTFDDKADNVFTQDTLRQVCLGLFSLCRGAASKYFNGQTNISDDKFLCFGVKGLLETNQRLKDAMLFNILSYMSSKLLGTGNTAASIDEMYLFLTNKTAIEYIRNAMKRVRKKDSAVLLASQNVDDFLLPEVREMTKPLFSIPTHQFLFYPGNVNVRDICDALTLEAHEYDLIKSSSRGTCLYRCGNERYLLEVKAPDHKSKLFGSAGGR